MEEDTKKTVKDGRIVLLERLLANAQLTRMSRKTDPITASFASELEAEFHRRLDLLTHPEQKAAA